MTKFLPSILSELIFFKILLFKDGAKYKKLERLIDGFS